MVGSTPVTKGGGWKFDVGGIMNFSFEGSSVNCFSGLCAISRMSPRRSPSKLKKSDNEKVVF